MGTTFGLRRSTDSSWRRCTSQRTAPVPVAQVNGCRVHGAPGAFLPQWSHVCRTRKHTRTNRMVFRNLLSTSLSACLSYTHTLLCVPDELLFPLLISRVCRFRINSDLISLLLLLPMCIDSKLLLAISVAALASSSKTLVGTGQELPVALQPSLR